MRRSVAGAAVTLAALLSGPSAADEGLVVAFRQDAPPFSEYDPAEDRFRGFIAEICYKILDLIGPVEDMKPVDARTRWDLIDRPVADGGVHLLCDTTSVTIERARERLFSPVIFLSGVSYAFSPSRAEAEVAEFEAAAKEGRQARSIDDSAAPYCSSASETLVPRMPPDRTPLLRIGTVAGTTAPEAARSEAARNIYRLREGEAVCIDPVDGSYRTAIDRLCKGEFSYFFGDRDMLVAAFDDYKESGGPDCDAIVSSKFFSFEPYALVVRADRPDLLLKVQAALYEVFSDEETINAVISDHFRDRRPSELNQALFRINGIARLVGSTAN